MDIRLKIRHTDGDTEVSTSPRVIIAWERKFSTKVSALSSGVIGMEDLVFMAYSSTAPGCSFDKWIDGLLSVDVIDTTSADPFHQAPTVG